VPPLDRQVKANGGFPPPVDQPGVVEVLKSKVPPVGTSLSRRSPFKDIEGGGLCGGDSRRDGGGGSVA